MLINHASKQVTAKIVYYGAGLSGKTTNLQYIFSVTNPKARGELVSMETEIERTLFFDLLPINVGLIKGYQTRFQLYTVPGQIFYDSTRKLVLKGADGIVFVVDSQELMEPANLESYQNLQDNLSFYNCHVKEMPFVFQYNKRDLKNILPVDRINHHLNQFRQPFFEAVAKAGSGVIETLRDISSQILVKIKQNLDQETASGYRPMVNFDVDRNQKIKKIAELPLKRISADQDNTSDAMLTVSQAGLEEVAEISFDEPVEEGPQKAVVEEIGPLKNLSEGLFDKLKDPSRLTKIERIHITQPQLEIAIKDGNGNVIKSLPLHAEKEIKKINIILDIDR